MRLAELPTPALVIEAARLEGNLATMARRRPGAGLRPHVKAHQCSAVAHRQRVHGHTGFTCATPHEVMGLAAAGLGDDLLLANEVLDPDRLARLARLDARVTVAVDSIETIAATAEAGLSEVLIDVNVGLPRCGCPPEAAGELAERARARGLSVRGVMGYEGHLQMVLDPAEQVARVAEAMDKLAAAHRAVGGELISAGGTGTEAVNRVANEIQAGSYALMDSDYARRGLPFDQAVWVLATVISIGDGWFVLDAGLKALGMDHGPPTVPGASVWFVSDEHTTASSERPVRLGQRVAIVPAHLDPTMARHRRAHVVGDRVLDDEGTVDPDATVVEVWDIDLRGWD